MPAVQQVMMATGAPGGEPAAGDIDTMMCADVEPTAGGAPHAFTTTGLATVTTPIGVHVRCYDASATDPNIAVSTPSSTISIRMRFQLRALPGAGSNTRLIRCNGGGTADHTEVQVSDAGALRVVRNLSTILDGPTTNLMTVDTWFTLELTTVIADAPGGSFTANLYDDAETLLTTGADALTATGVDTRDGGTGLVTNIILCDNSLDAYIDDITIDITGALYGPAEVEALPPNGAGDLSQLTPSGAGANYEQVDEVPCDSAAYNASTGMDQYDTYAFPSIAVAGNPFALGGFVAVVASSGTPQFNLVLRKGGVTYEHPTVFTSSATNKFYFAGWRNNPETGTAWVTQAEMNAFQLGIHMHAANCRIHGYYREVLVEL